VKITGGRVTAVEAERLEGTKFTGFEVNIQITEVKEAGKNLEVHYTHDTRYRDDFARMRIKGLVSAEADEKERKKILEEWGENKQLPAGDAEEFLMAVNYATSAVGTLLAFAINVNAPLNIPRTRIVPALPGEKAG